MEEVDLCMRESGREVVNWNILLLVLMLFFHQRGYVGVSATDEGLPKYCLCSYLSHFPAILVMTHTCLFSHIIQGSDVQSTTVLQ